MQFVSANDVKEGMCVSEDVRDPQGRTLIARGQRLGSHHIVRLRKFGIDHVFIDPTNGEQVQKPSKSEIREQCYKVLGSSCNKLQSEFKEKKINLDAASIKEAAEHLIEALTRSKNPLVTLLDLDCSTGTDRLMQHSVNTTVLATVLAIDLHVPHAMLFDLAVGMLFHDIGMIFLPDALLQKTEGLNAEEVQALRRHSQQGFEYLVRTDAVTTIAANIALRHHETLDGTGYPQGVPAEKLSMLMKIAAVVETFDALTSKGCGSPAVMPDAAITYIISNVGKLFAKEVVVALAQRVALYPQGTAVQMNSGEIGTVAGVLPTAPTRPVVLIHFDRKGSRFKEPLIVDLTRDAGRCIARSAHTIEQLINIKDPLQAPRPVNPIYASLG